MTTDFTAISEIFRIIQPFDNGWIIPLVITMIVCLIVSKDVSKWGIITFPVTIMLYIAGVRTHAGIIVLSSIWFILTAFALFTGKNVLQVGENMVTKNLLTRKAKKMTSSEDKFNSLVQELNEKQMLSNLRKAWRGGRR